MQATILTEIRGKDQRTYTLSSQGHLSLQHSGNANTNGGNNVLMGLRGKGSLPRVTSRSGAVLLGAAKL